GQQALENVAMYGSFNKSSNTWPDSLTGYPGGACNMDDCGYGQGSGCTALPASSPDWDLNGDGIPDTFYNASSASTIKQAIFNALQDILKRASSGTTVATLPPAQSGYASTIAQAYFYPEQQSGNVTLKWIGYLRILWIDSLGQLREDTVHDGIFDLILDKIIAFFFNTSDQKYAAKIYTPDNTLSSGGMTATSCSSTEKTSDDVTAVWEAGALLKAESPDSRTIKTWIDANNNGVVDTGEFQDFTTSLNTTLSGIWSYDSSDIGACDSNCATSVIKYIRGYDRPSPSGSTFRLRQSDNVSGSDVASSWKLGDIIFSTPKISPNKQVNGYDTRYGDATYKAFIDNKIAGTTPIVVVGANDGMVHAFQMGTLADINPPVTTTDQNGNLTSKQVAQLTGTGLGAEAWAFIPRNVLPYLRWYCQDNYCHIPMTDTVFTIVDASTGGNDTDAKPADGSSWRRLLIGQMGVGGNPITFGTGNSAVTYSSSIFVLDITNPTTPNLLWEKQLPDHSLNLSTPGIVRLGGQNANGTWYLVLGSGPATITTPGTTYVQFPQVYVLNLKDGSLAASFNLHSIDQDAQNMAVGDFLATDLDLPTGDYQVDDLYFGTYNNTTGKLYRLRIRNGGGYITDPTQWQITKVLEPGQPIFAAPAAALDNNNQIWLYTGTGVYLTADQKTDTNSTIYGIKEQDTCWQNGCSTPYSNFLDTTNFTFSGAQATEISCQCTGGIAISQQACAPPGTCPSCTDGTAVVTGTTDATLSGSGTSCDGQTGNAAITCLTDNVLNSKDGWMLTLAHTKIYSSPLVAGGIVSVTPFTPNTDPCQAGGTSNITALNYTTGTSFYNPVVLASGGTSGATTNVTIEKTTYLGQGAPPMKQSLVPLQTGGTYKVFSQAGGGITNITINPSINYSNKFILWITR
ncbi:MAG: PilC/PilY family type IV pilus protein, partial [Desulfobacteraceae bacterium]|nr:PilC/PilY family type IV pilus protein [Desulfobacteraceae bacterium]